MIGVPDDKWGEAIKAVVQLKPGQVSTGEEIITRVREALGGVQAPKTVEFRDNLPRSSNGKVLKRTIREQF